MHSPGETLGEDHIEVEGDKLCRGQKIKTLEGECRTTGENRG